MKTALVLLGILSLSACNRGDEGAPAAIVERDQARGGLDRAHRAYAAGQERAMTRELLAVLRDPATDDVARANAIELVDQSYAQGRGRLDSGFETPEGMTWMRLVLQHGENDGAPAHVAILNGGLAEGVAVSSIRVVRSRDARVLASNEDGIGWFETGGAVGNRYFYIHSSSSQTPMEAGAYRIQWTYADGRTGAADVLVPSLHFSALPEILEPARGAWAGGVRPTLRWKAPSWAADRAFGRVLFEARVADAGAYAPKERWSMWEWGASRSEATLGADGTPADAALEDGRSYHVAVQYQWRLQYGQLELGGAARTAHTFSAGDR